MAIPKESLEPEKESLMAISNGTTGNGHTRNIRLNYLLTPWSRVLLEKLTGL
jgi:hypothetical protein